jgi:hypothetical protein
LQELISMPNAYTENQLVELPAIGLLAALGWQTALALDEGSSPEMNLVLWVWVLSFHFPSPSA